MADHDVEIKLVDGLAVPQLQAINGRMRVGQTVRYFSNDGALLVRFDDGSPFNVSQITDELGHRLEKDGTFFCKCFLTIGWSPDRPESGGDHDVRP